MNATLGLTTTIAEALAFAAARLGAARVREPRLEARLLLGHAAGLALEQIVANPDRPLGAALQARFARLVDRRAGREPLAHITGRREFWSLPFKVTPNTLTPRPESETLVEAAFALVTDREARLCILDLGTGTGCLMLALLSELTNAAGLGVDLSEPAIRVARDNAVALGLARRARFLVGNWGAALGSRFDLVVANPPYVPEGKIDRLEPEVARFEPRLALAGGRDGLAAYRALAPRLPGLLAPTGRALLEIGQCQGDGVAEIMTAAGLGVLDRRADLAGIERCLILAPVPGAPARKRRASRPARKSRSAARRFLL